MEKDFLFYYNKIDDCIKYLTKDYEINGYFRDQLNPHLIFLKNNNGGEIVGFIIKNVSRLLKKLKTKMLDDSGFFYHKKEDFIEFYMTKCDVVDEIKNCGNSFNDYLNIFKKKEKTSFKTIGFKIDCLSKVMKKKLTVSDICWII